MPEPIPFRAVLAIEGVATSDRRIIEPGALAWRELPLSLMAIIEDSHGGMPTTTSVNVGRIDSVTREKAADLGAGANRIVGTGVFDGADPVAADIARKVGEQYLRGISVDVGDVESELEVLEEDEDGWPTDWLDHLTAGTIGMATVCGFAAFAGATIELTEPDALAASATTEQPREGLSVPQSTGEPWTLALVAATPPIAPPSSWFDDPQFDQLTPLTITEDGRVFGHMAAWDDNHRGIPAAQAPRVDNGYGQFHLGACRTAEGTTVAVGGLTIGTGHAPLHGISAHAAAEHYDNSGTRWADARVGNDDYGIWVAGAVLPDVDEVTLRRARGCALSGDWRRFVRGGELELIAALSVNVPGFAIPRPALVASMGETMALVAAGARAVAQAPRVGYVGDVTAQLATAVGQALAAERRKAKLREQMQPATTP